MLPRLLFFNMPLVYQQNINVHTKLGVWHISENEDFFLNKVSLQNEVRHPRKRLQHLAGRLLLKELYEDFPLELIRIADTRKPFLETEQYHFSISHCDDYAAVIVSTDNRVGVDIEVPHTKIERVTHKYLSAAEIRLLHAHNSNRVQNLTLGWSIKEALFKWYGNGEVDFIRHMTINRLQQNEHLFLAACSFKKEQLWELDVHAMIFGGNVLAWVLSG
ncbi:MAG: 4'-phosphopantetheinyl transferase superfamily protein [Ferruginibacter sp.]